MKLKTFVFFICFGISGYGHAVLEFEEITQKEDLIKSYPLYKQLNNHITEEDFAKNFEMAKQNHYHLYKAILLDEMKEEKQDIGLLGYQFIQQLYAGRYMHIDSLVIDEKYRKKGFGKEIMQFAYKKFLEDQKLNNCKDMRLETGIKRDQAQQFYEAIGMLKYGVAYKTTNNNSLK